MVGYGGKTINTLRLWAAAAPDEFNFQEFSHGDFVGAVAERLGAESLTRVLYPDDSTSLGQGLRFVQEYFLVACSLADIVRRFRRNNPDWSSSSGEGRHTAQRHTSGDGGAGVDADSARRGEARMGRSLGPDAKERWHTPITPYCPKLSRNGRSNGSRYSYRAICEIIFEINRRLLDDVRARFPGDDGRVARISLIEEGPNKHVRMANLAIVGSHSTNGVAEIHSQLLRTTTVKDLAEMFPERFNNKTNGVTPRRWLLLANPALARTITRGDRRRLDYRSEPVEQTEAACRRHRAFATTSARPLVETKVRFADWLKSKFGVTVDPDTIFDSQVKRIHEYKRQLLNALRIVVLYNRLRENPNARDDSPGRSSSQGKRRQATTSPSSS